MFSNNANQSTPSGGLFGNAPLANAGSSTNIFGAAAQPTSASTGFFSGASAPSGLGGTSGSTGGTTGNSLFGGILPNRPSPMTGSVGTNTQPPGGNLFGGTGSSTPASGSPAFSLFTQPKPNEQPGPTGTTLTPSTTAPGNMATPTTTTTSGGLFSSKPPEGAPTPASTAAPSGGLFGGGLFGSKPDSSSAGVATPANSGMPTSAGVFPGNRLGGNGAAPISNLPSFSLGGTSASSTPSAPPPNATIFASKKPEERKDTAAPTPAASLFTAAKDGTGDKRDTSATISPFSLDKANATSTPITSLAPASTTLGAATSAPAVSVPPPSILKGKSIEEIVNKWTNELELHVREFSKYASEITAWDRSLVENGNNLAALYGAVLAAEREQNDIDQSLDHIEQQQRDLSSTLEAYEKLTEEILGGQGGSLRALDTGPADTERDKNYILATELHGHLDDLSVSLVQMIDSVNTLSASSNDNKKGRLGEDPMDQIAQILSSHLASLQWIDGAVREVEGKVADIEKRVRGAGESVSGTTAASKPRGFGFGR